MADGSSCDDGYGGMVTVIYTAPGGDVTEIVGQPGASVMETAVRNGVDGIVGECGGSLSCATCHVFVAPETEPFTPPMSALEDDMLEGTAVDRRENSRLSCQIKLTDEGVYHVTMPEAQT
jgi:ferredoxin, 2Fe-2S